jgi:predicted unusual protein kinase regulating ubiquinone biosynthesis (AarF/ABC1/UbiB family)
MFVYYRPVYWIEHKATWRGPLVNHSFFQGNTSAPKCPLDSLGTTPPPLLLLLLLLLLLVYTYYFGGWEELLKELLRSSQSFLVAMLMDKLTGNVLHNRPQRAQELLELITALGTTAVKVGQVLSVRPDLIPQEFSGALATLQDQVPPFSCEQAKQFLLKELGPEKFAHLQGLEVGPVASASIGQVYKVMLGDKEVAVKVQRPNVLVEIALDLYLARQLAPVYKMITGASSGIKLLANEWGRGFIAELDYHREAANTIKFNEDICARNLNAIMAPIIVPEYSTERILVTE